MDKITLKAELKELQADIAKHGYVYARASGNNLIDSVKLAKRSKSWYYDLPKEEQERLELLASELAAAPRIKAMQRLEKLAGKSVDVLDRALENRDIRIQLTAAQDILNRLGITERVDRFEFSGDIKHSINFSEIIAGGDTD